MTQLCHHAVTAMPVDDSDLIRLDADRRTYDVFE